MRRPRPDFSNVPASHCHCHFPPPPPPPQVRARWGRAPGPQRSSPGCSREAGTEIGRRAALRQLPGRRPPGRGVGGRLFPQEVEVLFKGSDLLAWRPRPGLPGAGAGAEWAVGRCMGRLLAHLAVGCQPAPPLWAGRASGPAVWSPHEHRVQQGRPTTPLGGRMELRVPGAQRVGGGGGGKGWCLGGGHPVCVA